MSLTRLFYIGALVSVVYASSLQTSLAQPALPGSGAGIQVEKPPTVDSAAFIAAEDTLQAIQNLFQTRRRGGRLFAIQGGAGLLGAVGYLAMPVSDSSPSVFSYTANDKIQIVSILAAAGLPLLGVGISKISRFSKEKERALIQQYRAGQPLPAHISQRLKPKYFRAWPKM
ncbi:hypothetical protein [Hymenobacter qilianensis]|uniref:Uncharacterized protein n=1 Tax=Hymenobacter qilianensis TaxID=1385715 RepID=A0A7H0GX49_9BACT|nr:hypothetical protein [Hymenobacter qilianensis]QNP52865.1 hypothetical protein H9L05_03880 [Hymenobacter qilianensis]